MTRKLYFYVDETGQDTLGELFIVSVLVADEEREQAAQLCKAIEQTTGKGRTKWIKTGYAKRLAYIKGILQEPIFQGALNFAVYRDAKDYLTLTVQTIARAILAHAQGPYKATVLIDGLPRSQWRKVGSRLRHLRVRTRKVRGVRRDESNALIRLADALCGFVRAAISGQEEMKSLFEWGKKRGYLKNLGAKEKNPRG